MVTPTKHTEGKGTASLESSVIMDDMRVEDIMRSMHSSRFQHFGCTLTTPCIKLLRQNTSVEDQDRV